MRTSFHHQPEAQHPQSSAINKTPADYPIFGSFATELWSAPLGLITLSDWKKQFCVRGAHTHRVG